MPPLFARLALVLACLCASPAWAVEPVPVNTIVLNDSHPSFEVSTDIQTWIDTESQADIAQVAGLPRLFATVPVTQRQPITSRDTLWIKLTVVKAQGSTAHWRLNIPLPALDAVTLYQRSTDTNLWGEQSAGDTLPQSAWARQGLHAEFDLHLREGSPQEIYLKVRNFRHVNLPLRMATQQANEHQRLLEISLLCLMLGTTLSLAVLSLVRYLEHRSHADILASVYALLVLLAVAQINGLLNFAVWRHAPQWGDYASSILPVLAVGAGLLFLRNLYALSIHYHRYDIFLGRTAWLTIASVWGGALFDIATATLIASSVIAFAITVGMAATVLSWRGNSSIWRWLMLAYTPQYLGMMRILCESLGLTPTLWEMRYVTSVCVALSVPVLLYALSRVTHDRKELTMRANHLPTQDALTGLLTPQAFHIQLEAAFERTIANREPIALVLVHVVNHEAIRESLGDAVAEQCLLRAVVKLHRILRDIDPAGRVNTAHFGLLLEGVTSRKILTERMVQLIGSGLIPLPGLHPPVTLQFQAACVLLHENPVEPEEVLVQLETLLETMSPNTRRPIRFLEPVPTQAAPLQTEMGPL